MKVTSFHFMPYRGAGHRGAGHVPQWEQPDAVQPLVLDFLGA